MKRLIIFFLFAFALIGLCYAQSANDKNSNTSDEGDYSEPGYKWGLYFDVNTLGATYFNVGLGLSLFDNNVRIQGQWGIAPEADRYVGDVIGFKLLANIFYLPLECLFGPSWGFYSMNLALGANFSWFLMDDGRSSMYMGAVLAQLDIANIDFQFFNPKWKYFSKYALYIQPELWFASTDAITDDLGNTVSKTIFRISIGLRLNAFMDESKVGIRPGNKIDYSAPGFIQGLYFDGMALGGFDWSAGIGLSFFDDNVKVQAQAAQVPSGDRYSGWAFGGKILGNVWAQNLAQWFGPNWGFWKTSVALGANFTYFLMEEGENPLWMGEFLGQWEIIKMDMGFFIPKWKYFKSFSIYVEPGIWFAPSDVDMSMDTNALRTIFRIGLGGRVSLF
jgi:hypothetical protein